MQILSEFLHPTRWYSKLIAATLALGVFMFLAVSVAAGYVVYRIVAPVGAAPAMDLTNFPGHPEDAVYTVPGGGERSGWFFPGLKSAPTILLCPGYQTSRGESLPLAAALQDHGYNVFVFDFSGDGASRPYSSLGFREVQELRAALESVAEREDVDRSRFGLWGANMGAYAAVSVAASDPRVRALIVESVYDHPRNLAALLVEHQGVAALPMVGAFAQTGFLWLHNSERDTPPLSAGLDSLSGVPKLFIEASEEPELGAATQEIFRLAPEPKEIVVLAQRQYSRLMDESKRAYENRMISFFLLNLPLQAPPTVTVVER